MSDSQTDLIVRDALRVLGEEAFWRKYRKAWSQPLIDLWEVALEKKESLGEAFWDYWMEGYAEGYASEHPWLLVRAESIIGWSDLSPLTGDRLARLAGLVMGAYRLNVRPKTS